MMNRVLLMVASLALVLASLAPAGADKLRYGHIANAARSPASLPLYVAQRKGFLAREGIELEVVPLPGLIAMIDALDKGEVELSLVATPFLIEGVMKGSDAAGVVGGSATSIHSLMARPDITSFADLKGKTIGLSTPPDTLSIATRLLIAKHGVDAADYQVAEMQGTPVRLACMMKEICAAAALNQPEDLILIEKGYHKLGDSLEVMPELQFLVVAASRRWAAQHRDAVVRFARAYGDAYRFIRDPAHRDEVVAILVDTTKVTESIARAMLALYFEPDRGALPRQAEISIRGVEKAIALLVETGQLAKREPVERFIDLQYLRAAGLQ
jgi:ABC-type nitrate/sulfonate/bicarbonate transport system substrate-binding protein